MTVLGNPTFSSFDSQMMRSAFGLARRGLGNVWPNPAVGCVIVKDGHVVGRGWTQPGGRPHAETEALSRAGPLTQGATAYVTLEPCCHWGKTPPCADALIAAGISRVAAAVEDPDPRVAGAGLTRLREGGLSVESGVCAAEAAELNAGFFQRVRQGRPLVTLKLAASLDGRIAAASGESRWITGEMARERVHLLRAAHDAVLVGTGTALADDPQLTCRLPGLGPRSPVRIVIDRQLRLPHSARLFADARQVPTWVLTSSSADAERLAVLRDAGIEVITAEPNGVGGIDLAAALGILGARGLTRLLVEGGGRLAAALLRAGLIDRLVWINAPMLIGGDGIPAVADLGLAKLANAPRFEHVATEILDGDVLSHFRARGGQPGGPSDQPLPGSGSATVVP